MGSTLSMRSTDSWSSARSRTLACIGSSTQSDGGYRRRVDDDRRAAVRRSPLSARTSEALRNHCDAMLGSPIDRRAGQ